MRFNHQNALAMLIAIGLCGVVGAAQLPLVREIEALPDLQISSSAPMGFAEPFRLNVIVPLAREARDNEPTNNPGFTVTFSSEEYQRLYELATISTGDLTIYFRLTGEDRQLLRRMARVPYLAEPAVSLLIYFGDVTDLRSLKEVLPPYMIGDSMLYILHSNLDVSDPEWAPIILEYLRSKMLSNFPMVEDEIHAAMALLFCKFGQDIPQQILFDYFLFLADKNELGGPEDVPAYRSVAGVDCTPRSHRELVEALLARDSGRVASILADALDESVRCDPFRSPSRSILTLRSGVLVGFAEDADELIPRDFSNRVQPGEDSDKLNAFKDLLELYIVQADRLAARALVTQLMGTAISSLEQCADPVEEWRYTHSGERFYRDDELREQMMSHRIRRTQAILDYLGSLDLSS